MRNRGAYQGQERELAACTVSTPVWAEGTSGLRYTEAVVLPVAATWLTGSMRDHPP